MFYSIVQDIQANGYLLPATFSYNSLHFPFAYPPLAFYVAGALSSGLKIPLIYLFMYMPPLLAGLSVIPFGILAYLVTRNKAWTVGAILVYAVLPSSFIPLIMGGGLTRSMGLFWALSALAFFVKWTYSRKRGDQLWTVAALSLTILSHPEMTIFAFLGIALFTVTRRVPLMDVGFTVLGATTLTSVWWGYILYKHGFAPYSAAFFTNLSTSNALFQGLLLWNFTKENVVTVVALLAMAGMVFHVSQKRYLMPVWYVAILIILRRGFETVAAIPLSIMAGEMMARVVSSLYAHSRMKWVVTGWLTVLSTSYLTTLQMPAFFRGLADIAVVSEADREAMVWVRENTANELFTVITPSPEYHWGLDMVSEWFPVIAKRQSVLTMQGTEWAERKAIEIFNKKNEMRECVNRGEIKCTSTPYVYLSSLPICMMENCIEIDKTKALLEKDGYDPIYEKDGIWVMKKRGIMAQQ